MTTTAAALIQDSIATSAIVHAAWTPELAADLLAESEDSTEASATVVEYWGTTDEGQEWRVHLDGARA